MKFITKVIIYFFYTIGFSFVMLIAVIINFLNHFLNSSWNKVDPSSGSQQWKRAISFSCRTATNARCGTEEEISRMWAGGCVLRSRPQRSFNKEALWRLAAALQHLSSSAASERRYVIVVVVRDGAHPLWGARRQQHAPLFHRLRHHRRRRRSRQNKATIVVRLVILGYRFFHLNCPHLTRILKFFSSTKTHI